VGVGSAALPVALIGVVGGALAMMMCFLTFGHGGPIVRRLRNGRQRVEWQGVVECRQEAWWRVRPKLVLISG
jgi:hypothetical protein